MLESLPESYWRRQGKPGGRYKNRNCPSSACSKSVGIPRPDSVTTKYNGHAAPINLYVSRHLLSHDEECLSI